MSRKIVQIIPAPANMVAYFDEYGRGTAISERVCCLALVEIDSVPEKSWEVWPMTMQKEGYADFPSEIGNFVCVEFEESPPRK